jgi:hypothetical protein
MLRAAVNIINQNHARGSRGSVVCNAAPSSHSNTHLSNSSRLFIGTGSKGENPQHTVREEYEQAQLYVIEINICNKVQTKQFPLPDYSSGQALQERARVRCKLIPSHFDSHNPNTLVTERSRSAQWPRRYPISKIYYLLSKI